MAIIAQSGVSDGERLAAGLRGVRGTARAVSFRSAGRDASRHVPSTPRTRSVGQSAGTARWAAMEVRAKREGSGGLGLAWAASIASPQPLSSRRRGLAHRPPRFVPVGCVAASIRDRELVALAIATAVAPSVEFSVEFSVAAWLAAPVGSRRGGQGMCSLPPMVFASSSTLSAPSVFTSLSSVFSLRRGGVNS